MGNFSKKKKRSSAEFNIFLAKTRAQVRQLQESENKNKSDSKQKMASPNLEHLLTSLPSFDGKKELNVKFYIDQFDQIAEQLKLKDELRLLYLKAKFSGKARERLANDMELSAENNYAKFKEKIILIFSSKISLNEAQESFFQIKQNPTESVEDFIARFNSESTKYFELTKLSDNNGAKQLFEILKLSKFLDGLKADIALEVRKKNVNSFKEACESALSMEAAFKATKYEEINSIMTGETRDFFDNIMQANKLQLETIEKLKADLENLKIQDQSKSESNDTVCKICKKSNHKTERCWFNNENKNQQFYRNRNFRQFPQYRQNFQMMSTPSNYSQYVNGFGSVGQWNPSHFQPMVHNNMSGFFPMNTGQAQDNANGFNFNQGQNVNFQQPNYENFREHSKNQGFQSTQGNYSRRNFNNRQNRQDNSHKQKNNNSNKNKNKDKNSSGNE